MPKWNCFTESGAFSGVVEADTEREAAHKAIEEFDVNVTRVELRSEIDESERHGKG
jgi:hypothetical protein